MTSEAQLNALVHDPKERIRYRQYNQAMVCSLLRNEPYSTAPVIAQWLGMGVHGTRRVLKRMVEEGLLIRDEVSWMGTRTMQIFAVSAIGRYAYMGDPSLHVKELDPPQREFTRGRVKPFMVEHTLMIQMCRLELMDEGINEYLDDEGDVIEPPQWMASSQMSGQNETRVSGRRWPIYPDGIYREVVISDEGGKNFIFLKAVEAERTRKSKKRYAEIFKAHKQNIAANRYIDVTYFVEAHLVESYRRLFHTIDADYENYLEVKPALKL